MALQVSQDFVRDYFVLQIYTTKRSSKAPNLWEAMFLSSQKSTNWNFFIPTLSQMAINLRQEKDRSCDTRSLL